MIYVFRCDCRNDYTFEINRPMSESGPAVCPCCGHETERRDYSDTGIVPMAFAWREENVFRLTKEELREDARAYEKSWEPAKDSVPIDKQEKIERFDSIHDAYERAGNMIREGEVHGVH